MHKLKQAIKRYAVDSMQITGQDTVTQRYCFTDNFIGFSGHFPGYPILPALVQLITALSLLEEQKGQTIRIASVENAKFLIEIRPGHEILVQCRECLVKERPGCRTQIMVGDRIAASFSMIFDER